MNNLFTAINRNSNLAESMDECIKVAWRSIPKGELPPALNLGQVAVCYVCGGSLRYQLLPDLEKREVFINLCNEMLANYKALQKTNTIAAKFAEKGGL